jgi:hypothetical protein
MFPVIGTNGSGYTEICVCGRTFFRQSAFTNHKRSCQKSQEHLSSALDKAKQRWSEKKTRRLLSSSIASNFTDIRNSETNVGPSALSVSGQVCRHAFMSELCHSN